VHSLRECPGIAVEQKAVGTICPRNPAGHDAIYDLIAYQASLLQDRAGNPAQIGTGLALSAEHLTSGDCRYVESFSKESSLRALTAPGRAE
jgi:hypothetical protein